MLRYFRKPPAAGPTVAEKDRETAKPAGESNAAAAGASTRIVISTPAQRETPILNHDDEQFLERLTSPDASTSNISHQRDGNDDGDDDDGGSSRPPLPPRIKTPDLTWDSDSESFRRVEAEIETTDNKQTLKDKPLPLKNRIGTLLRRGNTTTKKLSKGPKSDTLQVPSSSSSEAAREKADLTHILNDLNLSATTNNKAISLSAESAALITSFTTLLKDLYNGVPTAANDLVRLLDDPDGTLARNYDKLPLSLKKLVAQIPDKLGAVLAPELLAVAAEAHGLSKEEAAAAASASAAGGLKGAAKSFLAPRGIADLVTKPGAIAGMLKAIVNALKVRWPAFMGTNVLWSVAVFLLLFVLWYCHKRGREVRLEREKSADGAALKDGQKGEEGNANANAAATEDGGGASTPALHAPLQTQACEEQRQRDKEVVVV